MARLRMKFKNYFLTGLLVILPVFITGYIIAFLIRGMDAILKYVPPKYLPETYFNIYIPGLGLILVIIIIVVVGLLTRNIVGKKIVNIGENIVDRIPIVRIIYSGVKQLIEAFFLEKSTAFKRVALLEYPRRGIYVIGFITGEGKGEIQRKTNEKMLNVFVPTTPNPTSGFYIIIPEDELTILDMSVEDAFKLIISGGIFTPSEGKNSSKRLRCKPVENRTL
ncbi:MAG TPA: DUF502 domain-containing protein [Desulfatiglandales bacterium]|nr:DUF502 domain-containing protein [Desulfatiglandales bacterium]